MLARLLVFVLLVTAATSVSAAPKTRYLLEHHKAVGTCARMPHQLCTLYATSLEQRLRDEGRRLPRPLPTFPGFPSTTPSATFLSYTIPPAWLQQHYAVSPATLITPPSGGPGAPVTIMIMEYDHDPRADADLAVFRNQYGLPPCRLSTGCFTMWNASGVQENQNDPSTYPAIDPYGGDGIVQIETSLDLQAASSLCPSCKLAVVEVDITQDFTQAGFFKALKTGAQAIHPSVISVSYAWNESYDAYNDPVLASVHVPIAVASGDEGYQPDPAYPATSKYVMAVGWTNFNNGTFAWPDSGTGCSNVFSTPAWQAALNICNGRATADISAQGSYLSVFDSYCPQAAQRQPGGTCGWIFGTGTSASTPLVAAMYATAMQIVNASIAIATAQNCTPAQMARIHTIPVPSGLYAQSAFKYLDVTQIAGTIPPCSVALLCTVGPGWDGPSGWGNPVSALTFFPGVPPRGPYPAYGRCNAPYNPLFR